MSFITLLLYFFCTFIRPQDWVAPFYAMPLVNNLAYATIGLLVLERMSAKNKQFAIAQVPQNWLIIGLYLSILISHLAHTYFEGLNISFNLFMPNFVLFFLILNALNTEKKIKIAVWFIVLMILVLVPQGIYQVAHGVGWAGQEITYDYERKEQRINWIGIFNDPNDLALIFVVALGFILPFIFGKVNFFLRILNLGIVSALFYGIFLTNSRGGLIALIVTMFFYFVRITRKFVLGGVLGGLMTIGIMALGPSRAGIINASEASANSRIELWYEGILMLKSNPLFGVGHNMFMEAVSQTAHNSFILAAAELGFFGLFFWMGLIYTSYKGLSIVQTNYPKLKNYAIGLQSGLIGFCAAAFFLSRTYVILPYLLFAFAGAMVAVSKQQNSEIKITFDKNDFRNVALLSIGVVILIYIFIKVGI